MQSLIAGQKLKLAALTNQTNIQVDIRVDHPDIDLAVFGLDGERRLADDRYFVFYNQPQSPEGAIRLSGEPTRRVFMLELGNLPLDIERLMFTATSDSQPINVMTGGSVRVADLGGTLLEYVPVIQGRETALILLELYRHQGEWRVAAVGQGFNGGLRALLEDVGGEVEAESAPAGDSPDAQVQPGPVTSQTSASPSLGSAAAAGSTVKTPPVTLTKQASVSLQKAATITAALEWTGQGDLDLYAFYILKGGQSGKVYYKDRGSNTKPPYITLSGDSRGAGREEVIIHRPDQLAHVLISAYSAVQNGLGSFSSYKPQAVITDALGQQVIVPLLSRNHFSFWAAITKMDFTADGQYSVAHVERYSGFMVENSPLLHPDGRFEMNKGEIEFKR